MKKGSILLFFLLILTPAVAGLSYSGYFEPLDNSTRIDRLDQLILNTTGGYIGFDYSQTGINANNFKEFYQAGNPNIIDVKNSTWVQATTDLLNWAYLYEDYGANHFNSFTIRARFSFNGYTSNGLYYPFSVCNEIGDYFNTSNGIFIRVGHSNAPDTYYIRLQLRQAGVASGHTRWDTNDTDNSAYYYLSLEKNGTRVSLLIYQNPAYSTLLKNQTLTLSGNHSYQYIHWGQTHDADLAGRGLNGDTLFLDDGSGGATEGVFYSTDLLNGVSSNCTTFLYNTTLSANSTISLEFSRDNSTFTALNSPVFNGLGAVSLDTLNYSSLYVRGNFTRVTGGVCNLNDFTVIYEEPGPSIDYRYGIAVVLFILGIIIGWGLIRRE